MKNPAQPLPADSKVRIGHVHLKVADLEGALGFYRDVLGFRLTQRYGRQAAFLAAGGYHHHIGLNTWESEGGRRPAPGTTGLYHVAILYPTRRELADALRRLIQAGIELDGASDHGVSEALYLSDPDGNGVELYWDRPEADWPRTANGELAMHTRPLNLASLLNELEKPEISLVGHESSDVSPLTPALSPLRGEGAARNQPLSTSDSHSVILQRNVASVGSKLSPTAIPP